MREIRFNTLLRFGKLSQQFWTDQWAKVERHRLLWCELNQKTLKAEKYQGLLDATTNNDLPSAGHNVILAPTITGSPRYIFGILVIFLYILLLRWYTEKLHDAMALVRRFGKSRLFITVTCNTNWPEIQDSLYPGETPYDRPDICAVSSIGYFFCFSKILEKKG